MKIFQDTCVFIDGATTSFSEILKQGLFTIMMISALTGFVLYLCLVFICLITGSKF